MDELAPSGSTPELYRQMAAVVGASGAPFGVMNGVGHFGPLEAPAQFASLLWEALAAVGESGERPGKSKL